MKKLPAPIIDCHVHLFPDRLFDAIWEYFENTYGIRLLHRLYYKECIDYLHAMGVGHIVYSNYAHRGGVARGINEWNLGVLDEFQELYCFASYHPDDSDALAMAKDILDHPRILGFKFQLLVQNFYPHDSRLFPLYEMVIERGKRFLFHAGTGPVGNRFVGIGHFRKLLRRYPELPATVAHMGALEYGEFIDLIDEYAGLSLDTAWAFLPESNRMCNLGSDVLECHRRKILYGSDFPNVMYPREVEIEYLLRLDLSQEFYDCVFRDNALALIGGPGGKR